MVAVLSSTHFTKSSISYSRLSDGLENRDIGLTHQMQSEIACDFRRYSSGEKTLSNKTTKIYTNCILYFTQKMVLFFLHIQHLFDDISKPILSKDVVYEEN